VLDCRGWKRPVLSPRGTSTFVPTLIRTQVDPCDVQVLLNIDMLLQIHRPRAGMKRHHAGEIAYYGGESL